MKLSFDSNNMVPVRALLALAVLLGHFQFFDVPGLMPYRHLAPPSVAMFLFISGYGLAHSYRKKGKSNLYSFFKRRLFRIVLPALLVSLLFILLFGMGGIGLLERVKLIVTKGKTLMPHYWFVWTILLFYLLFWASYRLLEGWKARLAVLAGVALYTVATVLSGFDRCWWICSLAFPTGLYFARFRDDIFCFCSKRKINYWLLIILATIVFGGFFLTGEPVLWTFCYVFIPFIGALVIARLPLDKLQLPILRFLGIISYEIYLVHITVMRLLRGSFYQISSNFLYVAAVVVLSIAMAYVIHLLYRWITQIVTR